MFELCGNRQFLTQKDLVMARMTAECFDPTAVSKYFVDFDQVEFSDYDQAVVRRIRTNTKFLGFMREDSRPWAKFSGYYHRGHIGYKVDDDNYLMATFTFEQNHLLGHNIYPASKDLKYFYIGWRGARGIAFHYTMSESDRRWWLDGTTRFREHPQIKMDFFDT